MSFIIAPHIYHQVARNAPQNRDHANICYLSTLPFEEQLIHICEGDGSQYSNHKVNALESLQYFILGVSNLPRMHKI